MSDQPPALVAQQALLALHREDSDTSLAACTPT